MNDLSVSESELEPFTGGSSDNYEPSSSESENSDNHDARVEKKRKTRNEASWKRNTRKRLLAEGKEHTSSRNKQNPQRSTGKDCRCKYKCFENVSEEKRAVIIQNFNEIGDKLKQDIYLTGLITRKPINLKRSAGIRKKANSVYMVRLGTFQQRVCKKGFCAVHGVSTKRVERLSSHISVNNATTAPLDMRGKHHNRPNSIPPEIMSQVSDHIKSFPRRTSHYSRSKNTKKYYLSPELNVKKMHELYLKKYEPDVYKYWFTDDRSSHKPKVTYDFYFRYFKANFNISFGHPRSDTCQVCDRIDNKLKGIDDLSQDQIKNLETEKTLHQSKAKVFFDDLKDKTKLAQDNPHVETLCFDHEQNAPLPKVPAGDAFYLRQLWMYNFCIYSSKNSKAHFYMYDEVTGRKTPNETISFLDHYFENVIGKEVNTLYLFSDNCGAQNKNNTLVQYLYTLVRKGRFQKIVHRFPEPGHSFLPCDRCFGVVEKHVRRIERIFIPSEYIKHYKDSSPKNFVVVPVTQDMIFNFAETLGVFFKKTAYSTEKEKFKISQYKVFEYSNEHITQIRCSSTGNFLIFYDFVLQKRPSECPNIQKKLLYSCPLVLKKAKYDNVMHLAKKYVPEADIAYYNSLAWDEGQIAADEETDVTQDGEFSDRE